MLPSDIRRPIDTSLALPGPARRLHPATASELERIRPRMTTAISSVLLLLAAAMLSACGDDTPPTGATTPNTARISFAATTGTTGAPLGDAAPAGVTDGTANAEAEGGSLVVTSGDDELVITRVQLVVRELELERAGDCTFASSERDDDESDDDDCEDSEIELGPFLVELPLNGSARPALSIPVPAGVYDELELVLHTPDDDDADDRAFLAANPLFRRISAIVEGTFNGQPFVYVSRARIKQELDFDPPLAVGEAGENVTVDVNVGAWFVRRGGGLISPLEGSLPGEARAKIETNIRHTFKVFRDRDRDGERDRD